MNQAPSFFVPEATPEEQESVYAGLAKIAESSVPALVERIYSIIFTHDKEEWTATVGESLRGIRRRITRSKGKKIERKQLVSDPAVVLAIFPGNPYTVVTNSWPATRIRSEWNNPILAGSPKSETRFSGSNAI